MNLASIDLDRLVVLHAVLQERSVTRAARKLHVTPSAVSNALAKLRDTFGDPLLVRSGRALVLTPRAEALAPKLADVVDAVERALEVGSSFDPARSTREFTLACSDAEQIAVVPSIAAAFASALPKASLRVLSVEQLEASGGLAAGGADVAIAPAHELGPGMHASDLYLEEAALVVRRGHPQASRKLTKAAFNALRHIDILLALGGGGIGHRVAEEFFAAHGLVRDIAISVPSFAAAAAVAAETDWMAGMPLRLATKFLRELPLEIVRPPIEPMTFRMQLLWHERTHADPAASFFRDLIVRSVRARRSARRGSSTHRRSRT